MKSKYGFALLLALGFLSQSAIAIEDSAFAKSLVPGPFVLPAKEGTTAWGMAPIYDDKGKVHVFNTITPIGEEWVVKSKIAHWVADKPEGPYTLLGDALSSTEVCYRSPQISRVGDTYVLVFVSSVRPDKDSADSEIRIATATSLNGPWKESQHNPILTDFEGYDGHGSNPSFVVAPDGQFRIFYTSFQKYRTHRGGLREVELATSDKIEGPYKKSESNPLITYLEDGLDVEDPYAFYYKGMYYMLMVDRKDVKALLEDRFRRSATPGGYRRGLIYQSKDGIDWGIPKVGYLTRDLYFGGDLARSERPHILWKNGKPDYLYLACHDDDPTAGYILKIKGWKGEPTE